jgi:UDP-glucose 4-epimerase
MFLSEDSLPRASINHPELRDVVEMDQLATNWMWKNQNEIETIVFRPCTIIGAKIKNTMTRYLTTPYAPVCADFNPMFQFVHEEDMALICCHSLKKLPTGVYNVAGSDVIGLDRAREVLEMPSIPIPSFVLHASAKLTRAVFWRFPEYLIDYIQYSCIIDNNLLIQHLGEDIFEYRAKEALLSCKGESDESR